MTYHTVPAVADLFADPLELLGYGFLGFSVVSLMFAAHALTSLNKITNANPENLRTKSSTTKIFMALTGFLTLMGFAFVVFEPDKTVTVSFIKSPDAVDREEFRGVILRLRDEDVVFDTREKIILKDDDVVTIYLMELHKLLSAQESRRQVDQIRASEPIVPVKADDEDGGI